MVTWEHKPSIESAPWITELIRAHTGLMPSDADDEIDATVFKPVEPRDVPATAVLNGLTDIKNARDLASASNTVKPGILFRCSSPVNASEGDLNILRNKLGIQNFVDMRTNFEVKEDPPCDFVESATIWKAERKNMFYAELQLQQGESDPPQRGHSLFRISIQEWMPYLTAFVWQLPLSRGLPIMFWVLISRTLGRLLGWKTPVPAVRSRVIREINKEGLPAMYTCILNTFGPEIALALQVILKAVRAGEPAVIFCKLGKDRTGLISALILACCAATEEEIVSDYVRSDNVVDLKSRMDPVKTSGLDTALFARAPPFAIACALDHINFVYGGTIEYLRRFGFDKEMQAELGTLLSPTGETPHIYEDHHH